MLLAGGLSRTLSNVAMAAFKHYCKIRVPDVHGEEEVREEMARLQMVRVQWQEVASLALECVGAFGWHSELVCNLHERTVEVVQDMALFFESEAVAGYGR